MKLKSMLKTEITISCKYHETSSIELVKHLKIEEK
jgi:hypothetical protein